MSPLLFALVDAVMWSRWRPALRRDQRRRADARRRGDRRMVQVWHKAMFLAKFIAIGEWRSLWGVL